MAAREWSLVLFTLLTQAAVGALLTLIVVELFFRSSNDEGSAPQAHRAALAGAFGALCVGLVLALFHLATPLQAWTAVLNFGSSWLSREIVFGGLLAGLLGASVIATRGNAAPSVRRALLLASGLAAVLFLHAQIRIYMLPAQPAWNNAATPAAFLASAARLGLLGVAVVWLSRSRATPQSDADGAAPGVVTTLTLAALVALFAEALILPTLFGALVRDASPAALESASLLGSEYGTLLGARLLLLGAGAVSLLLWLRARRAWSAAPVVWALGFVAVAEVCGRVLFYATQVRVGI